MHIIVAILTMYHIIIVTILKRVDHQGFVAMTQLPCHWVALKSMQLFHGCCASLMQHVYDILIQLEVVICCGHMQLIEYVIPQSHPASF